MYVTIVIPTYNRSGLLREALASVQRLVVPEGWRVDVAVVDNNSTDDTAAAVDSLKRSGPLEVRWILEMRQGLNQSRNRALIEATSDWIVYLDDDMVVDRLWLVGLSEAITVLGPECVTGPIEPYFEVPPPEWITKEMLDSVTSSYSCKGSELRLLEPQQAHELPGGNCAVRREEACRAGGFDLSLGRIGKGMLAGEDWEFASRMNRLGKRVAYSPRCRIRHRIDREKISRAGLRERWRGLGATQRALASLDGVGIPRAERLRLCRSMGRSMAKSYRLRLGGRLPRGVATQDELNALYIRGYLFHAPVPMPRTWPPVPLRTSGDSVESLFLSESRGHRGDRGA